MIKIFTAFFFISISNLNAQNLTQKFYNYNFELFPIKLKVQPKSVKKNFFPFTKNVQYLTEYNEFGQKNGFQIAYQQGGFVSSAVYYNNDIPVYEVINFENSNKAKRIINKNTSGQFNGKQRLWYLESETNKWASANFEFENGKFTKAFDKIDFPEYRLNFKDGILDGAFYFNDNIGCDCFYYGNSKDGVPIELIKIFVDKSLDFTFEAVEMKNEKFTYQSFGNVYGIRPIEEYEIKSKPIFVNNKNILFNDERDRNRIIFDSQMNFMQILMERMRNPAPKEMYIPDEIDWSDGSVAPPQPYTIPRRK